MHVGTRFTRDMKLRQHSSALLPGLDGTMEETDGLTEGFVCVPPIKQVPAKKSSKQRNKGTAAVCKEVMLENFLPAIKNKWPSVAKKKIIWINP